MAMLPLIVAAASADPPTRIEDYDLEDLLGSVTAATRRSQLRHVAPASVTVLDRRRIRASGARTVPELLREVPGVRVLRTAPGSWTVSLRAVGEVVGNELLVLVDGHQMNHVLDMSVDWSVLPVSIEQIERIEVVRGPVSTTYGANAFTGVINIVTARRSGAGGFAGVDEEGEHGEEAHLTLADERRGFAWSALALARSDGLARTSEALTQAWGLLAHHRSRTYGGIVTGTGRLSDRTTLTVRGQVARSWRSATDHLALGPDLLQTEQLGASVRLQVGDPADDRVAASVWVRAGHHRSSSAEPTWRLTYAGQADGEADAGFEVFAAIRPELTLSFGASSRLWMIDGGDLTPSLDWRPLVGGSAWVTCDWSVHRHVSLSVGNRLDRSTQLRKPGFAPRVTAIYHRRRFGLRLSGAVAYREPTLLELAGHFEVSGVDLFDGNPDLLAPWHRTAELAAVIVARRLQLFPTIYAQRQEQSLHREWSGGTTTFVNDAERHGSVGFELDSSASLGLADLSMTGWVGVPLRTVGTVDDVAVGSDQPHYGAAIGATVLASDAWELGARAVWTSQRDYALTLGVPPLDLDAAVPARVRGSLTVDWLAPTAVPLHVVGTLIVPVPGGLDTVYGWGADDAARAWLGVRWGAR